MNRALPIVAVALLATLAAGCEDSAAAPQRPINVRTVESATPRLSAIDPPPTLQDNLPPRSVLAPATTAGEPAVGRQPAPGTQPAKQATPSQEDEMRAKTNLPFTPLIAMDPVDGSKVSINADTPVFSHQDRWYYFSSAANKAAFRANPEQYVKGSLSTY